jgi:hypothetical protein
MIPTMRQTLRNIDPDLPIIGIARLSILGKMRRSLDRGRARPSSVPLA